MSAQRVSERYAKMIISSALEHKALDEVLSNSQVFLEALNNRELLLMYKSPIIDAAKKKEITKEIFQEKVSALFLSFIYLIIDKGRENVLVDILDATNKKGDEKNGITRITIVTATQVSELIIAEIKKVVKKLEETKKQIIAETKVDPSIIGGYKVLFDGKVYDASIENKLNQLKKTFSPA